jgi:hypothetical protein
MPRNEIELERVEQAEDLAESSDERFDRMAFAERVVALVRPPRTRVAICEGTRRVQITSGRQWGRPSDARWAILSVPHDASRRAIAQAVLGLGDFRSELEGQLDFPATSSIEAPYRGISRPWRLDVLVSWLGRASPVSEHRLESAQELEGEMKTPSSGRTA